MLRPTADRVRESLFNILEHGHQSLNGAVVLDGFAGTGALGLEALSRGAAHATFVETSRLALRALRQNIEKCRQTDNADIRETDIMHLPDSRTPVDFVFLDPPYKEGLAPLALNRLRTSNWIGPATKIVVETSASERLELDDALNITDRRQYGSTALHFAELSRLN